MLRGAWVFQLRRDPHNLGEMWGGMDPLPHLMETRSEGFTLERSGGIRHAETLDLRDLGGIHPERIDEVFGRIFVVGVHAVIVPRSVRDFKWSAQREWIPWDDLVAGVRAG